jgi:hypothetical protein
MLPTARRYLLVIGLLAAAVALTWGQRWALAARVSAGLPTPAAEGQDPAAPAPAYTYFLDIEGWYRITPYETVVRSPYDLSSASSEAMAAALPPTIGDWQQVGEDEYIGDDPAIVYYLNQPTVALQRTYQHPDGQSLTLALIGNVGEDSFLLFSHTPETCYPGRLWQIVENRRESALIDDRPMHAQYLLTQHAETGQKLLVLYWYLWDDPQRDSRAGVLSMRVNLFAPPDTGDEEVLARAWDFVRALFPVTIPWERF